MNKKEFIETLIDMGGCGAKPKSWARGWDDAISEVLGIAEELDEQETLSQEWIDKNKVARINDLRKMTTSDVVPVEKLKSLLVTKQDKPVIPKFVADWVADLSTDLEEVDETDDTFSHIKWTDEEPTEIKRGLEAGGMSVAELNRIINAKAHGYDSVPELAETPDIINEPSHYKGRHGLEAIEVVRNFGNDDMIAGFYWGNAIKYMTRYRNKNGLEDLKKARKNLDWLIEHMEGKK